MNDPNGLVYHKGDYHLCYQWCRGRTGDGDAMCWGHAAGPDLVHWKHLPVALEPDALGAIWSGSAVYDRDNTSGLFEAGGGLVAVFTHHARSGAERQSLAYSKDGGRTWVKHAGNPVIGDDASRDFRDPKVFWHEPTHRWVMIVGVKHRLYASRNLATWTLLGETGCSSECPDLFPLAIDGVAETKWVLSLAGRDYVVGSFDGVRFTPETEPRRVDGGMDFYAAQSWDGEPAGRRIWIGWLNNWQYARQVPDFGARGFMTVPRELSLHMGQGGIPSLVQRPVPELGSLRQAPVVMDSDGLARGRLVAAGDSPEIVALMRPAAGDRCGFKVRASASQETFIGYDASSNKAFVDRARSGSTAVGGCSSAPLNPRGGTVTVRVFVDRSSVEAFFNDGEVVITSQVYPDPASNGVSWVTENGRSRLESLVIYPLAGSSV